MTKALVTVLSLAVATALFTAPARAQDLDLSRLADWTDRIAEFVPDLDDLPSTSFRLFNPDRLFPGSPAHQVDEDTWRARVTTKSARDRPSLSMGAKDGGAGFILRF